jgi:hypothetical protein
MRLAPEERAGIEDLLTDFFRTIDGTIDRSIADMFTEDALFDFGAASRPVVRGRAVIAQMFAAPPTGRTMRHLWTGLRIVHVGENTVVADCQVAVYGQVDGEAPKVKHVCDTFFELARPTSDDGWLFSSHRRAIVFAL